MDSTRKTLLLDIDYTLFSGEIPRPHLKEFLETVYTKYDLAYYTAALPTRISEVNRILFHKLKVDEKVVRPLTRNGLHRDNCPMITVGGVEHKCLVKASEELRKPLESLILIDDNPLYDHPQKSQCIQAEGFSWNMEDDYLLRLMKQLMEL